MKIEIESASGTGPLADTRTVEVTPTINGCILKDSILTNKFYRVVVRAVLSNKYRFVVVANVVNACKIEFFNIHSEELNQWQSEYEKLCEP